MRQCGGKSRLRHGESSIGETWPVAWGVLTLFCENAFFIAKFKTRRADFLLGCAEWHARKRLVGYDFEFVHFPEHGVRERCGSMNLLSGGVAKFTLGWVVACWQCLGRATNLVSRGACALSTAAWSGSTFQVRAYGSGCSLYIRMITIANRVGNASKKFGHLAFRVGRFLQDARREEREGQSTFEKPWYRHQTESTAQRPRLGSNVK